MARDKHPGGRLDWADAAVPVLVSIGYVVRKGLTEPVAIVGTGIGQALAVAVLFIGARQILWAINRRRPNAGPRQPALAAGVGLLIFGYLMFRH